MLCPVVQGAKGAIVTDLQQGAPSAPPAGWYADPVRPGSTRYWSGTGWTDQVTSPVADAMAAPVVAPLGAMFDAARRRAGHRSMPRPASSRRRATFGAPPAPRETHANQSEWHQTRARPIQRVGAAPVSTTTSGVLEVRPAVTAIRTTATGSPGSRSSSPSSASRASRPACSGTCRRSPRASSPVRPIGISLLAFARAARHGSGRVLSIVAVVICAATLVAAWVVDPELIRGIVESIVGLLPA